MLTNPTYVPAVPDMDAADPLGTGALIEMFYRSIFPGINNVVAHVRIYSAICWMVGRIEETAAEIPSVDMLALSKTGLEKIQLLLTWYNRQNVVGMAGANRDFPTDNSRRTLSFTEIATAKVARILAEDPGATITDLGVQFLYELQYEPSLTGGLGFLERHPEVRDTYRLTAAGRKLADEYDKVIRGSMWYDWLADLNKVTTRFEEVQEMGDLLDVRTPSPGERRVFASAYYPVTKDDVTGSRVQYRCKGVTLLLRALEAEQAMRDPGTLGVDVEALRTTMARGTTLQGVPVNLQGLEEFQGWWMNLLLHELIRLSLDTLSRNVAVWIYDATLLELPRRDIAMCAEQLGERMESALPDKFRSDVRSYAAHLDMLRGATAETFYAASVAVPELRVDMQLERLLKVSNFDKETEEEREALVEAYRSLVFCAVEARQLVSNPHVEQIDLRNDRLPLAVLRGVLSDFEDDRPAAFFAHIIQFYVVLLHFNVVRERTARRDANNRFIFTIGEDGLEQVTTKGVFPGVGLGAARNRLRQALVILAQCGFVESRDGASSFVLTDAGRERLTRGVPDF
ncbi:hypothetical protein [Paraburkholderia phenoliruptrix]|uniref:hypothetical protein n=1 Tax=Paraburkholderia phenoliruptrix TaxID=252970 RepID=UPI002869EA37|nr:hypothetical protein [Paraburkholderia phenoliruptrix]WMY07290.1 hypothetical protein P3F88_13525 [Paraburkholderia phenoliruptrix]